MTKILLEQKDVNFSELCGFQPRQLEAARAVMDHTFTLYGGAAGGGKSYFLRWMAVYLLAYYAKKYGIKGVRLGLFCEDYPALKERQLSKVEFEFPKWLGSLNKSEHEFRLNPAFGGGIIAFRNLDDPSKYLSSEFVAILVDELTKNKRETFDFLNMRRRWPGIVDTKFLAATNPGEIGHGWVKKLWISRDFSGETFDPNKFTFISAKSSDNKYLGQEYEEQLATLPEKLRKAYKDGNWDIFAGQYFTDWNNKLHVCEPFEIPKGWARIRCMDYGYTKPSAVYWMAIDYDGKIYVYRELYGPGMLYKDLAQKIVEMTPLEENETLDYSVADTSMFGKDDQTGEYGNDVMANNGVDLIPANKDRVPGWNLFRQYLQQNMIVFFSNCRNAIRTIPALVHDDIRVEDVDSGGEDHAGDAIRYGLMSLPPIPQEIVIKDIPPNIYQNDPSAPWNQQKKGVGYNKIYSY